MKKDEKAKKKKKEVEKTEAPSKPEFKIVGLYGEIDEESAAKVSWDLLSLWDLHRQENWEREIEEMEAVRPSVEMLISSRGGSVWEMFAIYDLVRDMREDCDVVTKGLGKVMSAAVLLLAAGAKGQRKIGKNCRIMLHSVSGDASGHKADMENEVEETKRMQGMYVAALAEESKMTVKQINAILEKKVDVYFDAETAIKYGIADVII